MSPELDGVDIISKATSSFSSANDCAKLERTKHWEDSQRSVP